MKRIIGWLEAKLSRSKSPDLSDASSASESAKPDEIDLGIDLPKELRDLVNDAAIPDVDLPEDLREPAKIAPMPDIYAAEHVDTVPDLKILDPGTSDADESTGVNPYDTGVLQEK